MARTLDARAAAGTLLAAWPVEWKTQCSRGIVLVHQIELVFGEARRSQRFREEREAVGMQRRADETDVARDDHVLGSELAYPVDLGLGVRCRDPGGADLDECARRDRLFEQRRRHRARNIALVCDDHMLHA